MPELNLELKEIVNALQTGKTICLLAPSFPVDFSFPDLILDLRRIGFSKIVELTYAAKLINYKYINIINENPNKQFICGNCPTIIKVIENQYPDHKDDILDVASPMVVMARFVKREFGEDYKTIFVGPCFAKKAEAKENADCVDFAITFKELIEIYDYCEEKKILKNIEENKTTREFDKFYNDVTKIYPLGGGVASSMITKDILNLEQVIVCDGPKCIEKAMFDFSNNSKIRFLDILFCEGGCLGGPGIVCKDNLDIKKQRLFDYKDKSRYYEPNENYGKFVHAFGLDIKRKK
jgi:two-component system, NtrC family, sensor kinase